jgi:hypothetical protein
MLWLVSGQYSGLHAFLLTSERQVGWPTLPKGVVWGIHSMTSAVCGSTYHENNRSGPPRCGGASIVSLPSQLFIRVFLSSHHSRHRQHKQNHQQLTMSFKTTMTGFPSLRSTMSAGRLTGPRFNAQFGRELAQRGYSTNQAPRSAFRKWSTRLCESILSLLMSIWLIVQYCSLLSQRSTWPDRHSHRKSCSCFTRDMLPHHLKRTR